MWAAISTGPVAQFRPMMSMGYCSSTVAAVATSLPRSMVPVVSIVTCAMTGTRRGQVASTLKMAASAHLVWRRS